MVGADADGGTDGPRGSPRRVPAGRRQVVSRGNLWGGCLASLRRSGGRTHGGGTGDLHSSNANSARSAGDGKRHRNVPSAGRDFVGRGQAELDKEKRRRRHHG